LAVILTSLPRAGTPFGSSRFQLIPNSRRSTVVSTSNASRWLPYASGVGPTTVPPIVTGLVTPRSVISPSIVTSSPLRSMLFAVKRSSGCCSASKKSGVWRWPASCGSSMSTLATLATPSSLPSASLASNSLKPPRNVPAPL
jgi:hypothetical protein